MVSNGPWGGTGGMIFDDGVYTGVREVHLSRYGGVVSIRKPSGEAIMVETEELDWTRRKYGPFGEEQGISFSSGSGGIIVGFHGRKGLFVDSIGVHVVEKTVPKQLPKVRDSFDTSEIRTPEGKQYVVYKSSMTKMENQFGQLGMELAIKLEYPSEILTSVCGYYGSLTGDEDRKGVIKSLTFHTNKGKYGPFGEETGNLFHFCKEQRENCWVPWKEWMLLECNRNPSATIVVQ
ncbi:hypothetical protein Tsubulata_046269 [Turnera subulata]|uniref:Jacalin-type lectin domain-containing protein n=1 Tax=Turnera subulata TaxID=218843 RepID=A0A9Q0J8T9_9ROSI|nr:hypothetical protein Tsubulata_046269 [Turnera subulata]